MSDPIQDKIADDVKKNAVMIYMKGTPQFPQCGFSAAVVQVFKELGVPFGAADVFGEDGLRDGIKQFTSWPTIPQVFVGGEFIGGCDIVRELYAKGELKTMVEKALAPKTP